MKKNITETALLSALSFRLGVYMNVLIHVLALSTAGCKPPTLLPVTQTMCAAKRHTAPKLR